MAEHSDDDKTRSLPDDGDGDGTELVIREFNNPRRGHIFPRDGIFVGPSMERVTKFEWRFYDAGSNHYQDYIWTAASNPIEQPALHFKHGKNAIHHRYVRYSDNQDTEWFDTGWWNFVESVKHKIPDGAVYFTSLPTFAGEGEPHALVRLYKEDKTTPLSSAANVSPSGQWVLPLTTRLETGPNTLFVCQTVPTWQGEVWSSQIRVISYARPSITKPGPGAVIPSTGIFFEGRCTTGSTIVVVDADNHWMAYSDAKKFDNASWELPLKAGVKLPEGPVSIQVQYQFPGVPLGYSDAVTFTVEKEPVIPVTPIPVIKTPEPLTIQNTVFSVGGEKGMLGAKLEFFEDGQTLVVGRLNVVSVNWDATVTLTPGTHSVVVEQIFEGKRSGRSIPRAFRIRPPKVETATFDTPTDNKVVSFSGSGYTGASVEIRITSGPAGASLPRIVDVVGGKWKTTAPNWPYGTYVLKVIQKVPDMASGWIESEPLPLTVDHVLPDVSAVEVIADYQPIFSGQGYTGATVKLFNADGVTPIAPGVKVYEGKWKTTATEVWGPTLNRKVHIKQYLNGQASPNWIVVPVTIAPLPPVVTAVLGDGLSPIIRGTCWPGAELTHEFNVDGVFHKPRNNNGRWEFKRYLPFATGVTHTFTVIQHYAGQISSPASGTFVVYRPMVQPLITYPGPNAKVGRDVTVCGTGGMKGATMQLRNVRSGRDLGPPIVLNADGTWSIDVVGLVFDLHTIDARQTLDGRESVRSQQVAFDVVLLPPEITVPEQNDTHERTSLVTGTGIPFGRVELWLAGMTSPWQTDIAVRANGEWEQSVSLPVGNKTIWALQTFVLDGKTYQSQNTEPVTYAVVPAAPFIESPAADEHVGRRMVVSGFGVVGDMVMAMLGAAMGSDEVKQDRTWSITLDADQIGGVRDLVVVSTCSDFESAPAKRTVVQGTYLPTLSRPAAGSRVANPVQFAGLGRAGIGEVRSWYDPDLKWVPQVPVTDGAWHAPATRSLPANGCWCWFKQTLTDDANGETVSDWVLSNRFEVDLTGEKKT